MGGYTRAQITDDGTGWPSDTRFVPMRESYFAEFAQLVARANKAAYGDSNDDEIEALREAMEFAAGLFGIESEV